MRFAHVSLMIVLMLLFLAPFTFALSTPRGGSSSGGTGSFELPQDIGGKIEPSPEGVKRDRSSTPSERASKRAGIAAERRAMNYNKLPKVTITAQKVPRHAPRDVKVQETNTVVETVETATCSSQRLKLAEATSFGCEEGVSSFGDGKETGLYVGKQKPAVVETVLEGQGSTFQVTSSVDFPGQQTVDVYFKINGAWKGVAYGLEPGKALTTHTIDVGDYVLDDTVEVRLEGYSPKKTLNTRSAGGAVWSLDSVALVEEEPSTINVPNPGSGTPGHLGTTMTFESLSNINTGIGPLPHPLEEEEVPPPGPPPFTITTELIGPLSTTPDGGPFPSSFVEEEEPEEDPEEESEEEPADDEPVDSELILSIAIGHPLARTPGPAQQPTSIGSSTASETENTEETTTPQQAGDQNVAELGEPLPITGAATANFLQNNRAGVGLLLLVLALLGVIGYRRSSVSGRR
jgi:hypothetical protein